jgi:hypothetical protein
VSEGTADRAWQRPAGIVTTQKYLHTLPNADAEAVPALDSIHKRIA